VKNLKLLGLSLELRFQENQIHFMRIKMQMAIVKVIISRRRSELEQ